MLNQILANAPLYLLIAVRALAMIEVAPLISSDAIPQVAKVSLAGFAAFMVFPQAAPIDLPQEVFNLTYLLLVIGEAFIGIIIGFYLTIIYSAFSSAGQFFSLQMGFGASETYDPLAQIENPLMGQYLNLIGMLVFLSVDGFQQLFLGGFQRSVQSFNVLTLITAREGILNVMIKGLSQLFVDALVISMPILGTLFLISLAMGLLSKAAPQMNLLTEGFPISITVAFILIMATMPFLVEAFAYVINNGFSILERVITSMGRQL
ncbi:flagellar biosynthetic protein FliR [Gracilinema caldarium]|uniref:Flagellar biosynthetic protein FliR n=1 Tax=Gracilinema caldarium (strain ATCC 51460 / DSM 7334 / H1) TaxID=744872 RepID=F8EZ79_GRAC1|nr:flagellar biosynthetic protein FliR [Gracilinema caldarium]AEJ19671.1 flagellar biosynthetic protein FliR [Gracilinema caldarium DSM 7334]